MNPGEPSIPLAVIAGATWCRDFTLAVTQRGRQTPLGDAGWGLEFGIVVGDSHLYWTPNSATRSVIAVATLQNQRAGWRGPGIATVAFAAAETIDWRWRTGTYYLDLISPDTRVDPDGARSTILRGPITCSARGDGVEPDRVVDRHWPSPYAAWCGGHR